MVITLFLGYGSLQEPVNYIPFLSHSLREMVLGSPVEERTYEHSHHFVAALTNELRPSPFPQDTPHFNLAVAPQLLV